MSKDEAPPSGSIQNPTEIHEREENTERKEKTQKQEKFSLVLKDFEQEVSSEKGSMDDITLNIINGQKTDVHLTICRFLVTAAESWKNHKKCKGLF